MDHRKDGRTHHRHEGHTQPTGANAPRRVPEAAARRRAGPRKCRNAEAGTNTVAEAQAKQKGRPKNTRGRRGQEENIKHKNKNHVARDVGAEERGLEGGGGGGVGVRHGEEKKGRGGSRTHVYISKETKGVRSGVCSSNGSRKSRRCKFLEEEEKS